MDLKKAEPFICSLDIHKKYLLPLFHLYSVCDATWKVSIDAAWPIYLWAEWITSLLSGSTTNCIYCMAQKLGLAWLAWPSRATCSRQLYARHKVNRQYSWFASQNFSIDKLLGILSITQFEGLPYNIQYLTTMEEFVMHVDKLSVLGLQVSSNE